MEGVDVVIRVWGCKTLLHSPAHSLGLHSSCTHGILRECCTRVMMNHPTENYYRRMRCMNHPAINISPWPRPGDRTRLHEQSHHSRMRDDYHTNVALGQENHDR